MTERISRDEYFLGIAEAVSARADCTRRQVGVVIIDTGGRIVSTGYNGAPPGDPGCLTADACPRGRMSKEEVAPLSSYDTGDGSCIAVHAEVNALMHGDWARYQDGTMYLNADVRPCDGCWRIVRGAGIKRVVWIGGSWEYANPF